MNCMYCQGDMKPGAAPFHIDRKGYHLSLDDVPALVCAQCGEAYFDEAQAGSIQAVIRAVDEQLEKLSVSA